MELIEFTTYDLYIIRTSKFSIINYSYIIIDNKTKEAVVVDPAWDMREIDNIIEVKGGKLSSVLLTHSHIEHVYGVEYLQSKYNCDVYMSQEEIMFYHYSCNGLRHFQDLHVLNIGNTSIKCIVTPGHTTGSTCFLLPNAILTGDTVFIEGCGICSERGGSAEQMFKSIQRLKLILSPEIGIYPAHSYGSKFGKNISDLMKINIYFQIDNVDQFVAFRMRKDQKNLFNFK